jgi:hypothetical protein
MTVGELKRWLNACEDDDTPIVVYDTSTTSEFTINLVDERAFCDGICLNIDGYEPIRDTEEQNHETP